MISNIPTAWMALRAALTLQLIQPSVAQHPESEIVRHARAALATFGIPASLEVIDQSREFRTRCASGRRTGECEVLSNARDNCVAVFSRRIVCDLAFFVKLEALVQLYSLSLLDCTSRYLERTERFPDRDWPWIGFVFEERLAEARSRRLPQDATLWLPQGTEFFLRSGWANASLSERRRHVETLRSEADRCTSRSPMPSKLRAALAWFFIGHETAHIELRHVPAGAVPLKVHRAALNRGVASRDDERREREADSVSAARIGEFSNESEVVGAATFVWPLLRLEEIAGAISSSALRPARGDSSEVSISVRQALLMLPAYRSRTCRGSHPAIAVRYAAIASTQQLSGKWVQSDGAGGWMPVDIDEVRREILASARYC